MISANAALINNKLIPNYSSYNIQYAANELVVAYTNKSKNASQINSNNWYQILSTPGVKYAVSDPNSDPAGQYSVMMLQLANSYYNNSTIFSSLISDNSAITSVANNTTNGTNYVINAPTNENPHGDLTIGADAAALTQSANLSYVTLPSELSLTNASFQSDYNTIQLKQFSDANNSSVVKMQPIIYGITILNNAPDKQLAEEYVQLMLSSTGINITQSNYLIPITPAILTNVSTNLPSSLQSYVVNASATNLP
jgi:molybdate/tungstate transport system substrate-binding protein